jgi:hypothetical protein
MKQPWENPSDAPVIEQSIHDYIVSVFRAHRVHRPEIVPISPGAEASRGWDASVVEVVPLFFQYKLPDYTSRLLQSQPANARIRKDFGFSDDNGAFHFRLRKKASKEPRSQHELMLEMEKNGYQIYYVSTTFVDAARLRFGGDLHASGRPWISRNHVISSRSEQVLEYIAPWFDGLICIPPFKDVSAPVEKHKFIYNEYLEVSLHSDPVQARAVPLIQMLSDQVYQFEGDASINERNVDYHVNSILDSIAGRLRHEREGMAVRDYYLSLVSGSETYRKSVMGKLRPLAQVLKALTGIDVFFIPRLKGRRGYW